MRKLGTMQLEILRCFYQHGKYPHGGWCWDNYSHTMGVTKTLAKRGLVELKTYTGTTKTMLGTFPNTYEYYEITEEGKAAVLKAFPNIPKYT